MTRSEVGDEIEYLELWWMAAMEDVPLPPRWQFAAWRRRFPKNAVIDAIKRTARKFKGQAEPTERHSRYVTGCLLRMEKKEQATA
jgi:hypothetical protein